MARKIHIYILLLFVSFLCCDDCGKGARAGFYHPAGSRASESQPYAALGMVFPQKYHAGVDYALECGSDVFAFYGGVIYGIVSGDREWGNAVTIRHEMQSGEIFSFYAHLSEAAAVKGAVIKGGEGIGASGTSGVSSGCHLHFALRRDAEFRSGYTEAHPDKDGYLNPAAFGL
ncbi:MAG: M23 family metallopeptidase [Deltaproteobacteria bacterium]|nr:M23 family metallopeptidase [Deltaproteobacteria bacterium]